MPYIIKELIEVGMPIAMTALVEAAGKRRPITYKQITELIEPVLRTTVAHEHIGHVVGSMMFAIQDAEPDAPLINLICVNGVTKLPGTGAHDFLKAYNPTINYKGLKNAQKRAVLRPFVDEVYNFEDWRRLAKKVFGIVVPIIDRPEPAEADGKAQRLGIARGGPPESKEHIRLKEYVCSNPTLVGAPKGCKKGWPEKQLLSLDEIDVWFMVPGKELAVEVKSRRSNDFDLQRGIYQCVKYRAVLEAENGANNLKSTVNACLVSERKLPDDLARLAKRLDIDVRVLRPLPAIAKS